MTNATLQSSGALFSQWRTEQAKVVEQIRTVRELVSRLAASSMRNTPELAHCVRALEACVRGHFRCETDTYEALKEELGCVEVTSAKRQADADQVHLLSRLSLIAEELEGSCEHANSWESAIEKLDWFFDDLDQHHERESESIEWLTQNGCG